MAREDPETLDPLAREVVRLRYWQLRLNEDLKQKRFTIPIHVAIGHEAIAVAVHTAMEPADQLVLTHRNVAYNLARAGALEPIYHEYALEPTGVSGGQLGSMNLANPARGVMYASSILGNNLAVACGLALGQQMQHRQGCVIVLTGDGAMEEGPFYEGVVFAQSHHLPLVILVENNNYSMSSTIAQRRCPIAINRLCEAVGMPFQPLQGNEVTTYAAALRTLCAAAREGQPACLEVTLTTFNQHAGPTPGWPTDPKRINLEDGLVVNRSVNDPVFVIHQQLGAPRFDALAEDVMAQPPVESRGEPLADTGAQRGIETTVGG